MIWGVEKTVEQTTGFSRPGKEIAARTISYLQVGCGNKQAKTPTQRIRIQQF